MHAHCGVLAASKPLTLQNLPKKWEGSAKLCLSHVHTAAWVRGSGGEVLWGPTLLSLMSHYPCLGVAILITFLRFFTVFSRCPPPKTFVSQEKGSESLNQKISSKKIEN